MPYKYTCIFNMIMFQWPPYPPGKLFKYFPVENKKYS